MDATYHKIAQTIAFNQAAAATTIVFSPDADKRFVVTKWFLMSTGGAQDVTFLSAANPISGVMHMLADVAYQDGSGDEAVLIGQAIGEDLQITLGQAISTDGYVVIGQMQE